MVGVRGILHGSIPITPTTWVPFEGTLRFQVSFPGLGYNRDKDNVVVDVGPSKSWIIPLDGSTYYLSGTLSVRKEEGDHHHIDWSGTLTLPGAAIPKGKE